MVLSAAHWKHISGIQFNRNCVYQCHQGQKKWSKHTKMKHIAFFFFHLLNSPVFLMLTQWLCNLVCVCAVCALCLGMHSGSSTTGHWDNRSLDCRSRSCTVGTIHLNPAAAGKHGTMNEMGDRWVKVKKQRERERQTKELYSLLGPSRKKSQGEVKEKSRRAHAEWVGGC